MHVDGREVLQKGALAPPDTAATGANVVAITPSALEPALASAPRLLREQHEHLSVAMGARDVRGGAVRSGEVS